jgi:hypothetical protein
VVISGKKNEISFIHPHTLTHACTEQKKERIEKHRKSENKQNDRCNAARGEQQQQQHEL